MHGEYRVGEISVQWEHHPAAAGTRASIRQLSETVILPIGLIPPSAATHELIQMILEKNNIMVLGRKNIYKWVFKSIVPSWDPVQHVQYRHGGL